MAVFVAFVAVVAVLALPDKAPTKVVEVTEVSPARVVAVAPKETLVDPIVMLELVNALFGMFVKLAPEPLNTVAVQRTRAGVKLVLCGRNIFSR